MGALFVLGVFMKKQLFALFMVLTIGFASMNAVHEFPVMVGNVNIGPLLFSWLERQEAAAKAAAKAIPATVTSFFQGKASTSGVCHAIGKHPLKTIFYVGSTVALVYGVYQLYCWYKTK